MVATVKVEEKAFKEGQKNRRIRRIWTEQDTGASSPAWWRGAESRGQRVHANPDRGAISEGSIDRYKEYAPATAQLSRPDSTTLS